MADAFKDATAGGYEPVADGDEEIAVAAKTKTPAERTTDAITTDDMPDRGVKSFFDFDADLSEQNAMLVKSELKIAAPAMPDLAIEVIQATHRTMREHKLASRLPHEDLGFFLTTCNYGILSADVGDDVMKQKVMHALTAVEHHDIWKTSPASSNVTPQDCRLLCSSIKEAIDAIIAKQVADMHAIDLAYTACNKTTRKRFHEQKAGMQSTSGELMKEMLVASEAVGKMFKQYK